MLSFGVEWPLILSSVFMVESGRSWFRVGGGYWGLQAPVDIGQEMFSRFVTGLGELVFYDLWRKLLAVSAGEDGLAAWVPEPGKLGSFFRFWGLGDGMAIWVRFFVW